MTIRSHWPAVRRRLMVCVNLVLLASIVAGCTVASPKNTPSPAPATSETLVSIPPTEIPDPTDFLVTAEIDPSLSHNEIARILFSRWLDRLESKEIRVAWRLDAYEIGNIDDHIFQHCAQNPGAVFFVEAMVIMKPTNPLLCGNTECDRSSWVAGAGDIVDAYHINKPISGGIFRSGHIYTLQVTFDLPPC